jgi:hypothetical protein
MPYLPDRYELLDILLQYELPPLPDPTDDDNARDIILFRQDDTNIVIAEHVSLEDARAYATDEDTSGDGWFVGYRQ